MDLKTLNQQAILALRSRDTASAEALIAQLGALRPGHPQVNYLLGALRIQQGRSEEALGLLEKARQAGPNNVGVLLQMGNALQELKRFEEAVVRYDTALQLKPDFADALNNRANALGALKRFDAALASFDAALAIAPGDANTWYNRGTLLQTMGRSQDAVASFDRTLAIQPDHAETLSNKGCSLLALRQPEMALDCLDRAVALKPDRLDFHMNRASALSHLDRFGDALLEYESVRAVAPSFPRMFGQIALNALYNCDWERMAKIGAELPARVEAAEPGIDPWTLIGYGCGNGLIQQCARNVMREAIPEPLQPLWRGERYAHARTRVAYVSADFREHPVGFQLVDILERHDRSRFEVIAISSGQDDGGPIRARIIAASDRFHDMALAGDRDVAQALREMEVDIAVDLSGHTHGTRIGAFEHRFAPVQASWLGFPGTTGAREIDFVIGDAVVTPPEHQRFYDETILPLPGSFFPLDSTRGIGPAPSRKDAGLPDDAFVFCCFNRDWKILPGVFDIWLNLLRQVPGSVLWLRKHAANSDTVLRGRAEQRGIDPSRLVFAERAPTDVHLARHALADLFLDTSPYGAHATAADALWAGLPVLTQLGEVFAGRVGASLLTAAGLPEMITRSPQEYEATALALARDPARLKSIRQKLATNRAIAPLFDMARFTQGLEAAYDKMRVLKA
jgi:predicted O-linked N-acetylglucosamine transferase (SPINDLY family)